MTLRTQTILRAATLGALLCSVAPAALAQTVATASNASSGISQEAALALSADKGAVRDLSRLSDPAR